MAPGPPYRDDQEYPHHGRRHLFTPFDRLGAEHSGVESTGLGLALCKRLVEAMGGILGVESVVDEGSTFWIELPVADPAAPEPVQTGAAEGG